MTTTEQIQSNEVYKQILADSFGGVMYNVDNRSKYETSEILALWESLGASEREAAGGIMKGAMHFLQESN